MNHINGFHASNFGRAWRRDLSRCLILLVWDHFLRHMIDILRITISSRCKIHMLSRIYGKRSRSLRYAFINFSGLAQNHLQSSFPERLPVVALYNDEHGYLWAIYWIWQKVEGVFHKTWLQKASIDLGCLTLKGAWNTVAHLGRSWHSAKLNRATKMSPILAAHPTSNTLYCG